MSQATSVFQLPDSWRVLEFEGLENADWADPPTIIEARIRCASSRNRLNVAFVRALRDGARAALDTSDYEPAGEYVALARKAASEVFSSAGLPERARVTVYLKTLVLYAEYRVRAHSALDEASGLLLEAESIFHNSTRDLRIWAHILDVRGRIHRRLDQYEEAKRCFRDASSYYADCGDDHNAGRLYGQFALVCSDAKQYKLAFSGYVKALELMDPNKRATFAIMWYNMGLCLRRDHQPELANQAFRKAATLDPSIAEHPNLSWEKGKCLAAMQDLTGAQVSFLAAWTVYIDQSRGWEASLCGLDLAEVSLKLRQKRGAAEVAKKSLEVFSGSETTKYSLLAMQSFALATRLRIATPRLLRLIARQISNNPHFRSAVSAIRGYAVAWKNHSTAFFTSGDTDDAQQGQKRG